MFGSSLPPNVCRRAYVLCTLFVCVCVKLCPTHIVLFLFCFSSSCVPYVASFSGLSIIWLLRRYSLTFIYNSSVRKWVYYTNVYCNKVTGLSGKVLSNTSTNTVVEGCIVVRAWWMTDKNTIMLYIVIQYKRWHFARTKRLWYNIHQVCL